MRRTVNVSFKPCPRRPMTTPGENLDALFVAFDDFGVHTHGIADPEIRRVLCETVPTQFYQVMPGS